MKRINRLNQFFLLLLTATIVCSCDSDDDTIETPLEAWEREVNQLKDATSQFMDFTVASNNGLIDVSGYVPNMGHHYLNPQLVDGTFELDKPEIILYVPDGNGDMQMVAIEYAYCPK